MTEMTGGQALVQQLKREGVDLIFGLPGVQLDWAFDALYQARDDIRVIHARHEQGTAYMADGYARSTGKIGVFMVVPGPGVLNTMAALSTAYACNSPVLCVTGQIASRQIGLGKGALHEVKDQMQALSSVTKAQGRAASVESIPLLVHTAFEHLKTGRPQPVEIEIPPDLLMAKADIELIEPQSYPRPAGDPDAIERAARALGGARSPLIFTGGGVIGAGASEELRALAEMLEAPVTSSQNGRGAISDRSHLSFHTEAVGTLGPDADVVLAAGTRFMAGWSPWHPGEGQTVIQLDIDAEEIGRNHKPDIAIEADAKAGLAALADAVGRHNRKRDSRREELSSLQQRLIEAGKEMQPQAAYALAMREALPDDVIVFSESTQVGYWMDRLWPTYQPRTFLTAGYQGTLGYGFATAIGAQAGNPDRRVVSINGDGGFFYNVQELSTVVQQELPLITVVFNNNEWGNVKRSQEERFDNRVHLNQLHNPDLMLLAGAYGITGRRATSPEDLARALHESLAADEPVLIEVPVGDMEWFAGRRVDGVMRLGMQ